MAINVGDLTINTKPLISGLTSAVSIAEEQFNQLRQ